MTTISVIDTETTGDTEKDEVCELAVVTLPEPILASNRSIPESVEMPRLFSTLVKPLVPVDCRARAVHHITDAELSKSPLMSELIAGRGLPELLLPNDLMDCGDGGRGGRLVIVAHNLEFDIRMIRQSVPPDLRGGGVFPHEAVGQICTWRCAMHLCQEAPSHKLQALRYFLGLNESLLYYLMRGRADNSAHRAPYDAVVCAMLLQHFLTYNTLEHLERLTTEPVLLSTVRFGEHEGKPWSEVPYGYLTWIAKQGPEQPRVEGQKKRGFDQDTRHTALHHIARYKAEWSARDAKPRSDPPPGLPLTGGG